MLKMFLVTVLAIILLFVMVVILLFAMIDSIMKPSKDEVVRIASPNNKIDAVLVETNGGATTSYGYEIYVIKRGKKTSGKPPVYLYGTARNENAYGANLRWGSDNLLVIEYLSTRFSKVRKSVIKVNGQRVLISIREGVSDPSAPSGGMLYNIQSKKL